MVNQDRQVPMVHPARQDSPVCTYQLIYAFYCLCIVGENGQPGAPGSPGQPGTQGERGICPKYCALDGGVFFEDGTRR